jgi:hypothetical protein
MSISAELSCLSGGGFEDLEILWRNYVLRMDDGLPNYGRNTLVTEMLGV